MRTFALASLAGGLAACLPAQTFVVDANAGPGTQFTSLPAAVAAVPSGAVLDVRPGVYSGFSIAAKSLTILGRPGVRVIDLGNPPIRIDAIGSAQHVVLYGLELAHVSVVATVHCTNSTGTLVLDGCRSDSSTSPVGGRLVATDCTNLHVLRSTFATSGLFDSALQLQRSTATLTSSTFAAGLAVPLSISNSTVDGTDCTIRAGIIAPTIALHQSHLDLRAACILVASSGQGAIASGSGSIDLGTGAVLQNAPAQPFAAGIVVTPSTSPGLTATAGVLGGTATAALVGPALPGALAIGAPGPAYLPAGASHPVWLLPGTASVLALGALPLTASYAVPNAPWVQGVTLVWQGVGLLPNAAFEASNPVPALHR